VNGEYLLTWDRGTLKCEFRNKMGRAWEFRTYFTAVKL
jgi:hypothetical protein